MLANTPQPSDQDLQLQLLEIGHAKSVTVQIADSLKLDSASAEYERCMQASATTQGTDAPQPRDRQPSQVTDQPDSNLAENPDLEDKKAKPDSEEVKPKRKSAKIHAKLKINGGKRIRNRVLCPKYKVQWSEEDVSGPTPP